MPGARLVLPLLLLSATARAASPPDAWPAFRGTGDSVSAAQSLPLTWSETEGVAWRVPLPGYGQSSPVVWKDRVFVTAAEGDMKDTLVVLCLDLGTGKERWKKTFPATNRVKVTDYVSRAAPTPAADAGHVYALFESGDLFALDHDGKELWKRSLTTEYGKFTNNHGLGCSPALAGDKLLVLVAQADGYLLAVDTATGKNAWKADQSFGSSWSSPAVLPGDKPVAVVSTAGTAAGFDVATGKRLWEITGLSGNTVSSPTPAGGLVVLGSSDRGSQVGVKLGAGDADRVAWRSDGPVSSFGSPLVYDGYAFAVSKEGVAYGFDPATGKGLWDQRLTAGCWASPLGGAGRVYFFSRDGVTTVVKAAGEFEKLAENKLPVKKSRVYGVAAVEGALVVRTGDTLFKVGK